LLWRSVPLRLTRAQLTVPFWIYLANFVFGAVITLTQLDSRFWIPVGLGIVVGVIPAGFCWWSAPPESVHLTIHTVESRPDTAVAPALSGSTEG
ncbi:MAG: carotenoid biosynthesis protein, partial [Thermosynechococcaceae cyanobacterium]